MTDLEWPPLEYERWQATRDTLHRWLQIVGKIRTHLTPWTNHGWQSALYVTSSGLTTSLIPYAPHPFSIDFDLIRHQLIVQSARGERREVELRHLSVADFYNEVDEILKAFSVDVHYSRRPDELSDRTPFPGDTLHCEYSADDAFLFWRALVKSQGVMTRFRSRFVGKCSPVHFFWGAMDLACTRFSGRPAPEHPGGFPTLADRITKEAYSHEVSSCGFWPGDARFPEPAFYSYAYPSPAGFDEAKVPRGAFFHPELREFVLPYQTAAGSRDPDALVEAFFQATYDAAANLGKWDRSALEDSPYLSALQAG